MDTGILFIEDKQVIVDAPTRIGRSIESWNYTDRVMPVDISSVCNQLIIPNKIVSRNHALVWPELNESTKNPTGRFIIQDLDSKFGTEIRREGVYPITVSPLSPTLLKSDDEIILAPGFPKNSCRIKFEIREGTLSRFALIIGTDPDNSLFNIQNNVDDLKTVLIKLCFEKKNILTLTGPNVSKQDVLNKFAFLAEKTEERSLCIVYYLGHGSRNGVLQIKGTEPDINVDILYSLIAAFKGNKIVILDCCYAKNFEKIGTIPNCAFLGASQTNESAWYLAQKGGVFTRAILNMLNDAIAKNNNYIRIDRIEQVKNFKTIAHVPDQGFTMRGVVCFTGRVS